MPKKNDSIYNDDSEVIVYVEPEEGDAPDVTVDDVLEEMTEEDRELGAFLGAMIDPDDDRSDGSEWAGVTAEELEAMRPS